MRWIVTLVFVFSTIAGYQFVTRADRSAAVAPPPGAFWNNSAEAQWRRTTRGWEKLRQLEVLSEGRSSPSAASAVPGASMPHPLLLTAVLMTASIVALWGLPTIAAKATQSRMRQGRGCDPAGAPKIVLPHSRRSAAARSQST